MGQPTANPLSDHPTCSDKKLLTLLKSLSQKTGYIANQAICTVMED